MKWKLFKVLFILLLTAIGVDITSTFVGILIYPGFEQNPLFFQLGWIGVLLALGVFLTLYYKLSRYLYLKNKYFNIILGCVILLDIMRWIVAITNIYSLVNR